MLRIAPSLGCVTTGKKPVSTRCGSCKMLSRSCIGITGTSAFVSRSIHSAVVRVSKMRAKLRIDRIDIDRAPGKSREFRIAAQVVATGGLEEILPLLVIVDDHANKTVRGFVRPAVARQVPRIAASVERRLVGEPAHVIAHDKTRHGLEHRNIHALAAPGAVAMHQAGADRAHRGEADDAVDQRVGNIARNAVAGLRHQCGQRGGALDQIVIGGFCGIRPVLPKTEHAGIDQARIDLCDHVVAEAQALHRLRTDVVNQHVA